LLGGCCRWWWSHLLEAIEYDVGVKWVDTRRYKGLRYQLFREGIDPGRPEEAYKVCLTHREVSLGGIVMIYKLI
jgi:hypothetical protein